MKPRGWDSNIIIRIHSDFYCTCSGYFSSAIRFTGCRFFAVRPPCVPSVAKRRRGRCRMYARESDSKSKYPADTERRRTTGHCTCFTIIYIIWRRGNNKKKKKKKTVLTSCSVSVRNDRTILGTHKNVRQRWSGGAVSVRVVSIITESGQVRFHCMDGRIARNNIISDKLDSCQVILRFFFFLSSFFPLSLSRENSIFRFAFYSSSNSLPDTARYRTISFLGRAICCSCSSNTGLSTTTFRFRQDRWRFCP